MHPAVGDDLRETPRLVAALEERGAEMHVVHVQRIPLEVERHALRAAGLAGLPGEIYSACWVIGNRLRTTLPNWCAAQLTCRRHHPAHPQGGAERFGVPGAAGSGPDDFLQRDHVGVDGGEHRGNAVRPRRRSMPRQRWML